MIIRVSMGGEDNPVTVIKKEESSLRQTIKCADSAIGAVSTAFEECAGNDSHMADGLEVWPRDGDEVGYFCFPVRVNLKEGMEWADLFNVVGRRLATGLWNVIVVSREKHGTRREKKGIEEPALSQTIVSLLREVNQNSSVLTRRDN